MTDPIAEIRALRFQQQTLRKFRDAIIASIDRLLTTNTDLTAVTDVQQQLLDLAGTFFGALGDSVNDRQMLHDLVDMLQTAVDAVRNGLAVEVQRAASAEQTNTTAISNEATRAIGAEQGIIGSLSVEVARATKAETSNGQAIVNEITRATGAEQVNVKAISDESSRAKAAEQTLTTGLNAETSRALQAEQTLTASVTAEATTARAAETANAKAVSDETARAKSSEQTLTTGLSSEVTRATQAEATLTTNLTAETARATSAEQAASKAASDEATRAKAAEQANTTAIGNEVTRAQGAESTLTTNLSSEVTRAKAAESAEVTSRQQGDSTNATAITQETTDRKAADTAEATARANADSTETTNRTNADTALGTRIDNETTARIAGDAAAIVSALWFPPYAAGASYGQGGDAEVYVLTVGRLHVMPIFVPPNSAAIKSLQLEVISASGSGRTVRAGLWRDNGSGLPGALLYDGGAIPAPTSYPALMRWTPSAAISATGWLWMGVAQQGGTTGNPTQTRGLSGYMAGVRQSPTGQMGVGLVSSTDNVTGAFAANPAVVADGTNITPRVTLLF